RGLPSYHFITILRYQGKSVILCPYDTVMVVAEELLTTSNRSASIESRPNSGLTTRSRSAVQAPPLIGLSFPSIGGNFYFLFTLLPSSQDSARSLPRPRILLTPVSLESSESCPKTPTIDYLRWAHLLRTSTASPRSTAKESRYATEMRSTRLPCLGHAGRCLLLRPSV